VGAGPISLPQQTLHTTAYWTALDPDAWRSLGGARLEAGMQGLGHAMRAVAARRLMCDPGDLGALGEVRSVSTRRPTVTIYEVYPGGVGYARRLFELHDELLWGARELIRQCPCADGCPSCIGPLAGVAGSGGDEGNGTRATPLQPSAKSSCLRLLSATALPA
jgi:DEAD/DEAH box helicase domain-containing protein